MRWRIPFLLPTTVLALCYGVNTDPSPSSTGSALYPPGLLPLITRANALLSAGQFNDAVKAYSDAIGMLTTVSPSLSCISVRLGFADPFCHRTIAG